MDERNMLKKIAESACDIDIPDALHPHQVERTLEKRRQKRRQWQQRTAAAACLCICFGVGSFAFYSVSNPSGAAEEYYLQPTGQAERGSDNLQNDDAAVNENTAGKDTDTADGSVGKNASGADMEQGSAGANAVQGETGFVSGQDITDTDRAAEIPLKKIGKMYTLAGDYGDVYDVLKKTGSRKQDLERVHKEMEEADSDSAVSAGAESKDAALYNGSLAETDHSDTNLQVEGVDESDIVKTDGRYIYVVQDDRIQVLDVRDKMPKEAGVILPDLDEDTDRICEIYVADHVLTLIIQTEKTDMQQNRDGKAEFEIESVQNQESDTAEAMGDVDVIRIDTKVRTKVLTYDITHPEKAVQKDTVTQDGWYYTSRKMGGRLYLFTDQQLELPDNMTRRQAVDDAAAEEWIPSVNGSAVRPDCIYLQNSGNGGLLVSSIDLENHGSVTDTKLLINHFVQLYVTSSSIYLYYTDDTSNGGMTAEKTRIARFALDADGMIRAKAAAALKGEVMDTFAVHERDGYLQVLTSVTNADPWENRVYVLDADMQITGKLTGLAKGERIYSARFAGAIGYFVTYRNTDPLFTVDFSDPKEPKVIGELKVTGFSEYLHFWDENLLLGIGYETDPENGQQVGLKLSMFDISDPVNVKEKGRLVLKDVCYCEGMYDYKAILVSREKNMIALTTESYDDSYQKDYHVFSYSDGKFKSSLECTITNEVRYSVRNWRSVYVGDMLYLVGEKKTVAFDMRNDWKKIGRVKYGR